MGGTPSRPPIIPDTVYMSWCKDSTTNKYLPIYVDQGKVKKNTTGNLKYEAQCSDEKVGKRELYLHTLQQHIYNPDESAFAYAGIAAAAAGRGASAAAKATAKAIRNSHARQKDPERLAEYERLKAAQAATRKKQLNALGAAARGLGRGAYGLGAAASRLGRRTYSLGKNATKRLKNSNSYKWATGSGIHDVDLQSLFVNRNDLMKQRSSTTNSLAQAEIDRKIDVIKVSMKKRIDKLNLPDADIIQIIETFEEYFDKKYNKNHKFK